MPFVTVRGVSLYYETHGDAADPPLLMAHGLIGSIAHMRRFAERPADIAARGVRLVAYDARGHGRSGYTTNRADYRWAALAEDMHALMRALGIERASVYGGSMGAGTALMLALAHPAAVDKLIIQSPPPFGADLRPVQRMMGGLSVLYQLVGPKKAGAIVAALPQSRRLEPAAREGLRSFIASQRGGPAVPAIRGLLFDQPQLPADRMGEVEHSTLILTHPDDILHPLASGELLHERMAHARLAVAPTATYWEEHPEGLTHVVSAFVRGEPIAQGLPERHHEPAPAPEQAATQ